MCVTCSDVSYIKYNTHRYQNVDLADDQVFIINTISVGTVVIVIIIIKCESAVTVGLRTKGKINSIGFG